MKSIKLSDYFKLVKPTYVYLQITPHKSIRNYNSANISKAIAHTYRAINRRIYKAQKKLFFETNYKISYVIDIKDNNAKFYFIIPDCFKNIITEKCKEIWGKATLEIVDKIEEMNEDTDLYSLSYKKEDALSLAVDKKSNEPLNSILSVMDIMKDQDRIRVIYNFLPISQFGWLDRYNTTIEKIKEHKSIEKKQMSFDYIMRSLVINVFSLFDMIVQVINDFTGGAPEGSKESLYSAILGILEQQQSLSTNTNKKKEATILNTQIAIQSQSVDQTRRENNALSVAHGYRTLDEDNELIYKKQKHKIEIENYDFKIDTNTMSTDECSNFIQVPGRMLLLQHGIKHINVEENNIPEELREGTKRLGIATFKGNKIPTYLENEYNSGNLPLVLIGSQGGGKTTYIGNYAKDCVEAKEGVIVLDFIKNCELSDTIKHYVSKDKLIELDLSTEKDIQGLGYNEIEIKPNLDTFTKLKLASLQSQQIMSLIDSVSIGDPLSSRMRRFLNAAANIVFVQGYNSVKNVVECLEDFRKRKIYIDSLSLELKANLEDEINTLKELDEWTKGNKKENIEPEVSGTNSGKIEHILDRIGMLREDFKLKHMYNKSLKDNINLVKCMEQGKVVLIKMREADFPTKMQKNLLVTYFITKIWLASQLRGMINDKPLRCNIIIDEVFQAPTSMDILEYILPQSRKFACKFVFSTQYIKQLDKIFDTLEASGASFMMLTGSTEDDFNHFKSKLENFEYEDLRDMEKFSSLNLVKYSKGYASFITKLPKLI
ncbi:hypothetical protein NE398_16135 [Clostridium tertium]|uniref:AAA-like domain protein n=1 Tax=Clostridium tertium TaxID=1559 RepID=A0A9X3XN32_9CLOT|nr:hypothetical protein [Clostridium tertium]MDC4241666.1 hypothetical protein [Clostridium tertium]